MADSVNITVRVTDATGAGITSVRTSINAMRRDADRSAGAFDKLRASALSLLPALIPIGAQAGPLAAQFGAATAAVLAFGVAAGQQIVDVTQATKAQGAWDDAVAEHGRTSKKAAQAELEFQRTLEDMPAASRRVVAAFDGLQDEYKAWSDALADDTMPVFEHSLQTLAATLEPMTPTVRGAARELDRFVAVAAGGVSSDGFNDFMNRFDDFTEETLHRARVRLVEFIQAAQGDDVGADVEEFMDYAQRTGPLVGDTLMELTSALANLLAGASETGVSLLGVVNALARLASAIPPDLIGTLLSMYAAIKLVGLGVAGLSAVVTSGFITRLSTFFTTARASGVGAGLTAAAAGMSRMQKASLALGGLALVAVGISKIAEEARGAPPEVDELTTSLRRLADTGSFSGELAETFGDVDGLVEKIRMLEEAQAKANETALGFRVPVLDDVSDAVEGAVDDMVNGSESLNALKDDFESLDQAMAGLARGGNADEAAEAFNRIREAAVDQGITIMQLKDLFPDYLAAVEAVEAEQEAVARGMGLFGDQALEVTQRLEEQKASADGLREAIQQLNDVNRSALEGMIGFEAAIDAAATAAQENAGALAVVDGRLDLNSEAARTAAQALEDLASSTDEAAGAARESGASWTEVSDIYERGRQQLISNAEQMGLTTAQAKALADQILATPDRTAMLRGDISDLEAKLEEARDDLASVPDSRRANVRARISELKASLLTARRELASLRDRTVTVTTVRETIRRVSTDFSFFAHGGITGAAGGGPRSRQTLVGEHGPEIVDLPAGSRVRSNPDSRRIAAQMSAGGGGGPIVVNLVLDGRVVARALIDPLRYEVRAAGGNVQDFLGRN